MPLFNFANYPLGINLILLMMAASVVWFAGTRLAVYADGIADQTSLGRAFVGLLLLAGATSLPELANNNRNYSGLNFSDVSSNKGKNQVRFERSEPN